MSKLTNNQVLLNEILKQEFNEQDEYSIEDKYFEFYSSMQYLKKYDLSFDEINAGITGDGGDGGCDCIYTVLNGYLVHEDGELPTLSNKHNRIELLIIQNKNSSKFKEDVFEKWKTTSKNLMDLSGEDSDYSSRYNSEVINKFRIFKDTYIKLIRKNPIVHIKYIYISKGLEIHPNVLAQSDELKKTVKEIFPSKNVSCSVDFIDANKLMDLINVELVTDITLKLKEKPINIEGTFDYIGLVGLNDYFEFITDENNNLLRHIFESNVRDYQGKVSVNKDIQETLEKYDTGDFWWLNNGVTIIAGEVNPVSPKELMVSRPEIVNGLQTSSEIFNYYSDNIDLLKTENRNVMVRIIIPRNDEERDKIILATNNQTSIPKSSLRATDIIHRQIEMYFKSRGLFYDRRKNYYKNFGKKSNVIVTISFMSQCLMSVLLQKPDYARARPSTLISDEEIYKKLFNEEYSLEFYYVLARLGKTIENIIKKMTDYETSQKGDILYYVLYSVISKVTDEIEPKPKHIQNIDIDTISEDIILNVAEVVYKKYKELGGNSKVAKGSDLITEVKKLLEIKEI